MGKKEKAMDKPYSVNVNVDRGGPIYLHIQQHDGTAWHDKLKETVLDLALAKMVHEALGSAIERATK